jgi:excisionase family DNA binding protein
MFRARYIYVVREMLTVNEAALELRVSSRRVVAMVDAGVLRGIKKGSQWLIPSESIEFYSHTSLRQRGRPLSERAAWEVISHFDRYAADDDAALDRYRRLAHSRALHLQFFAHPQTLRQLSCVDGRFDGVVHPGGVVLSGRPTAALLGVPVDPTTVDVYVEGPLLGVFIEAVYAQESFEDPNLFVHVVHEAWPFTPHQQHAGPWVAWLDLEDRQDRSAVTLLERLLGGRSRA